MFEQKNVGISTVYIYHTPYTPQRRLDNTESFGRHPKIVDEYEKITRNKRIGRQDLQDNNYIRNSMAVLFKSCHFKVCFNFESIAEIQYLFSSSFVSCVSFS